MTKKTPTLAGLVVKKPAVTAPTAAPAVADAPAPAPTPSPAHAGGGVAGRKALTLKVDRQRYITLKSACLRLDTSVQEALTQALDDWLRKHATP